MLRDSYTSIKLIKQKYLTAQIEAIEQKKVQSAADKAKLDKLKEELRPISTFLTDAKKQRDAILKEIGIPPVFPSQTYY